MIFIDKISYSEYTKQIDVTLYNSNPEILSLEYILPEKATLIKIKGGVEYEYKATYTVSYFNKTATSGADYRSATVHIQTDSGVLSLDSESPQFDPSGFTVVVLDMTIGKITGSVVNPEELYKYKIRIVDSESGYQGGIRASKKLSRFSFYEQLMLNAIDLGYFLDAENFYSELKRMSEYGVPRIKKENCYL